MWYLRGVSHEVYKVVVFRYLCIRECFSQTSVYHVVVLLLVRLVCKPARMSLEGSRNRRFSSGGQSPRKVTVPHVTSAKPVECGALLFYNKGFFSCMLICEPAQER